MDLTTYVVDDDEAFCSSLTFLFRTEGIRCRAFQSAGSLLRQLNPSDRGCIITDLRMPGMDGMALVNHLRDMNCPMPVILITGHADVPLAIQAMKAGVADFIEKPFAGEVIISAVRRCLDAACAAELKERERAKIARRIALLTARERQIYAGVSDGLSSKAIGLALKISPRTVEIHRANVMSKMQAVNLSELIRMSLTSQAA